MARWHRSSNAGCLGLQFMTDRSIGQYALRMPPSETRQAILSAAITLMGRGGAGARSAAELAAEVGISKATVFHHFRSIDEIPVAALDLLTGLLLTASNGSSSG